MLEERPRYLEIKGSKKKVRMIARFRCCNEWRGNRYGETEEKKVCRTCRGEEETWQHLRERCLTRTDLGEEDIMLKDGEGTVDEKGLCEKKGRGSYRKQLRKSQNGRKNRRK